MRFGTRGTTLYEIGFSPSDPDTFYLSSRFGFVFGTNDGGISWKEGRLITRRSAFFGSIRPEEPPSGAPFSAQGNLRSLQYRGFLKNKLEDAYQFPYRTTNYQVLDFDPADPAYWGGMKASGHSDVGVYQLEDSRGGSSGGDAARLGVGLKMSAKRLGGLLRKRGKRPAGMNLQLLLTMRGSEPTYISKIAVHPTQPEVAFAATDMGLYQTTDGGYSWLNAYPGRNKKERQCLFVTYHPKDASRMFVGTVQGLLFSTDGGEKFQRVSGTQLSSSAATWIEFHPSDPEIIYAGSNIGAFRTMDGGKNWKWIYYETLRAANYITSIALDPRDPNIAYLSTYDGLFGTSDGGKTWTRPGAFLFTSASVDRILVDPTDPEHLVAMTYFRVWESFDRGETWSALYLDDGEFSPRTIKFDYHDPTVLWLLTSHELIRISPASGQAASFSGEAEIREIFAREPRMSGAIDATLRAFDVHLGDRMARRSQSRTRWWLPRVNVFAGMMDTTDGVDLQPTFLGGLTFQGQKHVLDRGLLKNQPYGGMLASWNFKGLVADMEELAFGRNFGTASRSYHYLKFEVNRLFEERKRLIIRLLSDPPDDRLDCLSLEMRLEELTAHLNALSNGAFEDAMTRLETGTFWEKKPGMHRCLNPDDDGDGILDSRDACPLQSGSAQNRGCPRSVQPRN